MNPLSVDWRFTLAAALIAGVAVTGCSQGNEETPSASQNQTQPASAESEQRTSANTHPVTGAPLAEEQVFTYRADRKSVV